MPLNLSAAHSSRITKRPHGKPALLKRSHSSPFAELRRQKPLQRSASKPENTTDSLEDEEDFFGDRLDDTGLVKSLAFDLNLRDVAQVIRYVQSHMFDPLPDRGGGFNSTRIAEILNFRTRLPPTVTISHVHAFIASPTASEREIAELSKAGIVRKLVIPGRGYGGSGIGEGLVLSADVKRLLDEDDTIEVATAHNFLRHIEEQPLAQRIDLTAFSAVEIIDLMRAGFITSLSVARDTAAISAQIPSADTMTKLSVATISKAASGSFAAVGGEAAIEEAGGRGGVRGDDTGMHRGSRTFGHRDDNGHQLFNLSLPGMGNYLRILSTARSHLISILTKSRFKEMPLYLLKERWDGAISADDPAAKAKKYRGEFMGTLPARTRKWKQFYGLSFEWILAECLGAGMLEVFETGSVGRAARIP